MIYLWKSGVEKANSFDPVKVREALIGISFHAPQGRVEVMPNHHLAQSVQITQITSTGGYKVVSKSRSPVISTAWNQYESFSRGFLVTGRIPPRESAISYEFLRIFLF